MVDYGQDKKYLYRIETLVDEEVCWVDIPVLNWIEALFFVALSLFLGSALITITFAFFCLYILYQIAKFRKKNMVLTHQLALVKHLNILPKFILHGIFPSLRGVESFSQSYRRTYDRF